MNEHTIGSGNRASLSTEAPLGEHAGVGGVLYCRPFFLGGGEGGSKRCVKERFGNG